MVRVFHQSLGQELVSAEEVLQGNILSVSSDEPRVRMSIDLGQATVSKGGANGQLFLLTTPQYPEWTIYIRDYQLLRRMKAEAGVHIPRKNLIDSGFAMVTACVFAVLAFFLLAYLAKDPLVEWAVWKIPKEYEVMLGKTVINQMVGVDSGKFQKSSEELIDLMAPLVEIAKNEGYELKLYIKNDGSLNAFALPGGFVTFNTGFLLAAETPEELLGVAAHELAHVTKRHSVKQIVQTLGTYAFLQVLFGDFTGMAGALVDNSSFLLARMYSREAEREADMAGLDYLYKSGVSGRGLLQFLKRVKKEAKKIKEKQPEAIKVISEVDFLSTHPATDERLAYLQTEIDSRESQIKNRIQQHKFDMEAFKTKIREVIGHGDAGKG